jgi:outer membrane receptor protein involved in Fe transport
LSVEGRSQSDRLTQIPKVGVSGAVVTGVAANPLKATFKSFSPRFTVDYQVTPDTMVYALYSKGVRPGGFNAGLVTAAPATVDALKAVVPSAGLTYEEEELENREIGIKSTLLDGRARVTLTYFDDQWKNGQVQNSVPVTAGGVTNLIGLTINNGVADLKGVEFEGQLQATRNLKLSATFGYNKTELVSYGVGAGQCGDCNFIYGSFGGAIGKALPTAPKITYTLGAEYNDKINDTYDWFSRADFMHQGEKFTDFTNVLRVGAQNTLNASIGIRTKNTTIELFGKNLTDDSTMNAALLGIDAFTFLLPPNKNEVRFSPPLPRSFGVRMYYNF